MNRKLIITLLILTALLPSAAVFSDAASAQDIEFSAEVDRTSLSIQDQLTLYVTVKGDVTNVPDPVLPRLSDFDILTRSQSHSVQIINFQSSATITYQFTMQPKKTGMLTISPITLDYDGKEYMTDPIKVEVTRGSAGRTAPPSPHGGPPVRMTPHRPPGPHQPFPTTMPTFPMPFDEPSGKIMAYASTDKKSVMVNEPVILTISFCYPAGITVESRIIPPANKGFLLEEVPQPQKKYTTIKGIQYAVEEHKFTLLPINSGKLTIESVAINYQVHDVFSSGADTIRTDPIDITVQDMPRNGAPEGFTNATGSFSVSASIEPQETPMDEPVTLVITVKGEGNISTLELPKLPAFPHFKKFDTTESHSLSLKGDTVSGEKVFKTVLIPQKTGDLTIPAINFPYYDIHKKEYMQISTSPLTLKVTPPTHGAATVPSPGGSAPVMEKTDIRFIKSLFSPGKASCGPLYRNPLFIALHFLPLLVIGGLIIAGKQRAQREKDPRGLKKSRAFRNFRIILEKARKELKKADYAAFFSSIQKALTDYLKDKYALAGTGLTIQQQREFFEEKKFPEERIRALETVVTTCERARFAPSTINEEECNEILKTIQELVAAMEKNTERS